MNPVELERKLAPLLGKEIARLVACTSRAHKDGADFQVPSYLVVILAEKLAEVSHV